MFYAQSTITVLYGGNEEREVKWKCHYTRKQRKCGWFPSADFINFGWFPSADFINFGCHNNIYPKEELFALILDSSWPGHFGCLFPMKNRQTLAHNIFIYVLSHILALVCYFLIKSWETLAHVAPIYISIHNTFATHVGIGLLFSSGNEEERNAGSSHPYMYYFCHPFWLCSWCHRHRLLGTKWQHSWSCFLNF